MAQFRLLIGPAGAGKTWRVIDELAQRAAMQPLPGPGQPPLMLIVPEQQALSAERAVLARLAELGGRPASARVRVASFNRLSALLLERSGGSWRGLSEAGRQMLTWRLLGSEPAAQRRFARAAVLADVLAELAQYGAHPAELAARARMLEKAAGALEGDDPAAAREQHRAAAKTAELAQLLELYRQAHTARGLSFAPLPACISELLQEANWPQLGATEVWIDGFASLTPAEESALRALLSSCRTVTATLLLDPARLDGPLPDDRYDWYAVTRESYRRWQAIARRAGAQVRTENLGQPLRWQAGSPLKALAEHGLQAAPVQESATETHLTAASPPAAGELPFTAALACGSERAEVDAAARFVLDLAARGLRFGELSIVTRALEPYADLLAARFSECRIPHFIDRRLALKHHPAVELLRCGIKLALGQAGEEDVYTLLKTDLLPLADGAAAAASDSAAYWPRVQAQRALVDELEDYAREHGLKAYHWLREQAWRWVRQLLTREDAVEDQTRQELLEAQAARLDAARRALLAPVAALAAELHAWPAEQRSVERLLAGAWTRLVGAQVAPLLELWAAEAEQPTCTQRAGQAAGHRAVLAELAALLDEMVLQAGDVLIGGDGPQCLSATELCAWLDFGLGQLSCGVAPAKLDSVMVTEIERGRHHPLRATLLLGLAEDAWPPARSETPYVSDRERALLNAAQAPDSARLLGGGATEAALREPYLAYVAATRASHYLWFSRPLADARGRPRQPSPYFAALCDALKLDGAPAPLPGLLDGPTQAASAGDVALLAALHADNPQLGELLAALPASQPALAALAWGRQRAQQGTHLPPLSAEMLSQLIEPHGDSRKLRASASRLETFAACPFKHFARYFLKLQTRPELAFDAIALGAFYHRVLERVVRRLRELHCTFSEQEAGLVRSVIDEALAQLGPLLTAESGRERAPLVIERARRLLYIYAAGASAALGQRAEDGQPQRAPALTELQFGYAGSLPPLSIALAQGTLEVAGYIDRLDIGPHGEATVVDYKLGQRKLEPALLAAGVQLQLLVYLLAVEGQRLPPAASADFAATPLAAYAAEYQPLELSWSKDRASNPAQRVPPSPKTRGRQPDAATASETLSQLLDSTRATLVRLAEELLQGDVRPYPLHEDKRNGYVACTFCDFRALCRFDPLAGDQYRVVQTAPAGGREGGA